MSNIEKKSIETSLDDQQLAIPSIDQINQAIKVLKEKQEKYTDWYVSDDRKEGGHGLINEVSAITKAIERLEELRLILDGPAQSNVLDFLKKNEIDVSKPHWEMTFYMNLQASLDNDPFY